MPQSMDHQAEPDHIRVAAGDVEGDSLRSSHLVQGQAPGGGAHVIMANTEGDFHFHDPGHQGLTISAGSGADQLRLAGQPTDVGPSTFLGDLTADGGPQAEHLLPYMEQSALLEAPGHDHQPGHVAHLHVGHDFDPTDAAAHVDLASHLHQPHL